MSTTTTSASPRGRPRGFDVEAALDSAVELFWRYGYEGTTVGALTRAMGINRPSMYAALGDKESVFRAAVARYAATQLGYARQALELPTAYEVVEALLRGQVRAVTRADAPAGCLSVQGGLSCSPDNAAVASFLSSSRLAGEAALAARLARAVDEGDLLPGTDPEGLARFLHVVQEGQAVHAAAGVSAEQLQVAVDHALRVLPVAEPGSGASA